MEKHYICYQKDGKPAYREATPEELATMQPAPIEWHYDDCNYRVTFTDETKKVWLDKYKENELLGNYPEIGALLDYVKNMSSKRVAINGTTHIYLEEIYPEHQAIIEANGAVVEIKP